MNFSEARLFAARFASGDHDPALHWDFFDWMEGASESELLLVAATYEAAWINAGIAANLLPTEEWKLQLELKLNKSDATPARKVAPVMKTFSRMARVAAAAIVIVISASAYFLFVHKQPRPGKLADTKTQPDVLAPATSRATVTLAGGQKIYLDSAANGKIADQGQTTITKTASGVLSYQSSGKEASVVYNTLTNPRGSKAVAISLSDGSQVWLNAESSLRYPVQFIRADRTVEITGEAYFEVAKNAKMPFHVKANDVDIQVLGTHFNVNAYTDEAELKTTLLEGSVRISRGDKSNIIKPGEQAQVNRSGTINILSGIEVDGVVAWKNGFFQFDRLDVGSIMRQVGRWYDVEVSYEVNKTFNRSFSGIVSRSSNISQVMKIMENADIHFRIEGKKIIITQ